MRNLSPDAVAEMLAQHTDEVYLHIVKITHPSLASPMRFVDNTEPITRSDGVYSPAAFKVQLPAENDDTPQIQLTIDNVDQSLIQALRPLQTAPTLAVSVIRASAPNQEEVGPFNVTLKQFTYDKYTITGVLGYEEDFLNEAFPKYQFTPQTTPGIF